MTETIGHNLHGWNPAMASAKSLRSPCWPWRCWPCTLRRWRSLLSLLLFSQSSSKLVDETIGGGAAGLPGGGGIIHELDEPVVGVPPLPTRLKMACPCCCWSPVSLGGSWGGGGDTGNAGRGLPCWMESGGVTLRFDPALWLLPASDTWCCNGECWVIGGWPITCILQQQQQQLNPNEKLKDFESGSQSIFVEQNVAWISFIYCLDLIQNKIHSLSLSLSCLYSSLPCCFHELINKFSVPYRNNNGTHANNDPWNHSIIWKLVFFSLDLFHLLLMEARPNV